MPREEAFHYVIEASCEPAVAIALLSDFSRHRELHPFIVRVEPRTPGPGVLRSYVISDRLPWGPLHIPTTYRADILIVTDDEVLTVARQRPGTTVRNHTRVRATPDGVRIEVAITLVAPTLLFGYALRQARIAHAGLATRISDRLNAAGQL